MTRPPDDSPIAIASDHAGFALKTVLADALRARGLADEPVDYPDFIRPAAEAVARGACGRGIVLGGSGNGEAMVANRVRGVRCALCWNVESARLARAHNDANMLSMGQRLVTREAALAILEAWLTTPFDGGRHARRIALIDIR